MTTRKSAEVTSIDAQPSVMLNPVYAKGKLRVAYGKYTITAADAGGALDGTGDYVEMTVPLPKGAFLIPHLCRLICSDLGTAVNVSVGTASSLAAFLAAQAADNGASSTSFPVAYVAPLTAEGHVCVSIIDTGSFALTEGATIEVWIVYADAN